MNGVGDHESPPGSRTGLVIMRVRQGALGPSIPQGAAAGPWLWLSPECRHLRALLLDSPASRTVTSQLLFLGSHPVFLKGLRIYNKSIYAMSPALAGRPLGKPESLLVTCNVKLGRKKPNIDTSSAAFPHRESLLL